MIIRRSIGVLIVTFAVLAAAPGFAGEMTTPFAGKAVNGGSVTHEHVDGKHVLTLSSDFKVPGSPDPHWQVVDTQGNVYLLHRVAIKDDKVNRSITLPAYIADIAKVQMWCAWAEVLLGEAVFPKLVMAHVRK